MMKKFYVLFIALIGVITLSACGQSTQSSTAGVSIEHLKGTTAFSTTPKKVVALEFSFVDSLYQIGVKPVGIADDGDTKRIISPISDFVAGYTSVGKRAQPDLEVIRSLQPDLIIADGKRHSEMYEQLTAIAPTIVLTSLEGSYSDIETSFTTIAKIFNKEAEAQTVIENAEKQLRDFQSKLTEAQKQLRILTAVPDTNSINAHTSGSYIGEVLTKAGLQPSVVETDAYKEMSIEQVIENNADIIIYMRKIEGSIVEQWQQNDLYKSSKAVANSKAYVTSNTDVWSRFRGYEALKQILVELEALIA